MALVTLLDLRTQARQRADIETSKHVKDLELNIYINNSIAELYDLICQKYGDDYFAASSVFSTAAGDTSYPLPSDFYKLLGVDLLRSGSDPGNASDWYTVKRFEFHERNRQNDALLRQPFGEPGFRYRLFGTNLILDSDPGGPYTLRVWYVPLPAQLSSDTDTFDGFNGWQEFVVVDAAIKALEKEESPTDALQMRKQMLINRIESAAGNRDANFSARISDTRALDTRNGMGFSGDFYY